MDTDGGADARTRRATFRPSTGEVPVASAGEDAERYDDDALAAAMADEAVRLGLTGAISTMPPPTTPAEAPAMPVFTLSEFPAPSGQPVLPIAPTATRRSIRDAEQSRAREQDSGGNVAPGERAATPAAPAASPPTSAASPPPADEDTAPVPEAPLSPDFPPAPGAPDDMGEFGGTSPLAPLSARAETPLLPGPPVTVPPVYDLVEPSPYSAVPSVFPFSFGPSVAGEQAPNAAPPSPSELESSVRSEAIDIFAPVTVASGESAAAEFEDADEPFSARSTMNPWLQTAAIDAAAMKAAGTVASAPVRASGPLFIPETSLSEPTPLDQRVGRASRLFWLWFAANSSVLSLAFGGAIFSLGMSLRQAVVAIFIGVAISFLPLGLGTLAGKWSGQPVMIVSRATFGHHGNLLPAAIALITRLFWGAVLLWMIAAATAHILVGAKLTGSLTELQLMVIVMAVGFLLALTVAFFGYALFARLQLAFGMLSALLIVTLFVITWPEVDLATALTVGDGPVILVVTGVVLVFSFVGLVWANSSGDLARYQRPSSNGAASMLWASFGTTLPTFLLIGYGAVLAASSATTAAGLGSNPLDTLAGLLPRWYPLPLIVATVLSLLSGVILSIYSGGFALAALGLRVSRSRATVIVGLLVFAVAIALGFTANNVVMVFRDLATTLAVPVAAWAGIFAAEMIIRRRRFDTESLASRGGIYPDVNWLNVMMLIVASAVGFGFTSGTIAGLGWEGYLFAALGVPLSSPLGSSDAGVLVALLLGLLTPLVAGVSTIRRQEIRRTPRS